MAVAIFGIVFAAFCVWLAVRIVNRQERGAKRTALGLFVVLVGYPLSIGPACWLSSRVGCGASIVTAVYSPMLMFVPTSASTMLMRYSAVVSAPKWSWDHLDVFLTPSGVRRIRVSIYWDRDL